MTGRATDDLIARLADAPARVGRRDAALRLTVAVLAGGVVTFAILIGWLGLRPDLAEAIHRVTIWMKWAYTASIAAIALIVVRRLARPETSRAPELWLLALPVGLLLATALAQLALTPRDERMAAWLGHSSRDCGMRIVVLAAPIFLGLLLAFRRFAPTRPQLTGAIMGLAAGGVGATLYGFACPETSALFVVTFYSLGMATAMLIGLLIGPRFLRW